AAHHGDGGLGEVEQAEDKAVEELHALSALGRGVAPRRHGLHVSSRREMPARPGENDRAHREVALDLVESLHQLLAHANVEGVPRLRPVHGERRDAIDAVNEQGLVSHRYLPPATSWSSRRTGRSFTSMVRDSPAPARRSPQAIAKANPEPPKTSMPRS